MLIKLKSGKKYEVPLPTIKDLVAVAMIVHDIPEDSQMDEIVLCDGTGRYARLYYLRYLHRKLGIPADELQ